MYEEAKQNLRMLKRNKVDLVLHAGDMSYEGGTIHLFSHVHTCEGRKYRHLSMLVHPTEDRTQNQPSRWLDMIKQNLGDEIPYIAVVGNHDSVRTRSFKICTAAFRRC